jgi:hypothetical protein
MSVTSGAVRLSTKNKIGLALAVLLALADVLGVLAIPALAASGEPGPPPEVMIACGVLGVITLVAVAYTVRSTSRVGARITCASCILSALTSIPAFFVADVPAELVVLAAAGIVLTLISVFLVLARPAASPT